MKNVFFLLLFVILMGFNNCIAQDTINWSPKYLLKWDDFQGRIDSSAEFGAVTYAGIKYSVSFSDKSFTYKVYCYFDKRISWARFKSGYGLIHEQGHFNIAELFARKLRKRFADYKFNFATFDHDVTAIFDQIMAERKKLDSLYDKETDFSRNHAGQKKWDEKIISELLKLTDYK